jgi:hypothetical protein
MSHAKRMVIKWKTWKLRVGEVTSAENYGNLLAHAVLSMFVP